MNVLIHLLEFEFFNIIIQYFCLREGLKLFSWIQSPIKFQKIKSEHFGHPEICHIKYTKLLYLQYVASAKLYTDNTYLPHL